MPKPYRYAITYGLSGCYMPDSHYGSYEGNSRRELAALIRDALDLYGLPKSLFREARITRLWAFIQHHGSSTAHFNLDHCPNRLSFHGLTEDEYREQADNDD